MYNSDVPSRAELPTSRQLLRSTIIAALAALAILLTIVLPAEYGIDPTGVGRVMGLAEMGDIKVQLSREAEADRAIDSSRIPALPAPAQPERRSGSIGAIFAQLLIRPAMAQTAPRSDEMSVTLKPGEGAEVKLVMKKGAKARFAWKTDGGLVNCDLHGEPDNAPSKTHTYKRTRGAAEESGSIEAAFDGNHGWFWRNRGTEDVTVTVQATGSYAAIKRVL
jgi:hypothetical protein